MNCELGECTVTEEIHEGQRLLWRLQGHLEEMFSDSHLAEDGFLLKHIQKNKEGFVSLKLLTCLKKIKVLTNNWYMTLAAALLSSVLEVNSDSNKVRRLQAYPDWLLCSPTSKLLLLWNIPSDWLSPPHPRPSISNHIIAKINSYGTTVCHWLLLPGQDLPRELRCYAKRQKELGQGLCVVVKFDTLAGIRKAYDGFKAEETASAGEGVRVVSLGYRSSYLMSKEQPTQDMNQGDAGDLRATVNAQSEVEVNAEVREDAVVEMEKAFHAGDSPDINRVLRWRNQRINLQMPKNRVQVVRQPFGPNDTKGFQLRRKPAV